MLWCEIGATWFETGDNIKSLQCYNKGQQILQEAGIKVSSAWGKD